jgi:hypothetical protein
VRTFLRRCRFCTIVPATAAYDLKFDERDASAFLRELASLGLIESVDHIPRREAEAYEIINRGLAFANASAARPITRKTAESVLAQFIERLHAVNANAEYVYRVESAVLFGSMLTDTVIRSVSATWISRSNCPRKQLGKKRSTSGVTGVEMQRLRLGSASSPILTA